MKMHIREFANLTGVSVRTLHYYDEIGLLKPSAVDGQNGYRFYDENCLERMQEILFYRELDFPLKEIHKIINSPDYDKKTALSRQKHLLTLKKQRIERLISALDGAMKGENLPMNIFDNSEFEKTRQQYAKEVQEKWGNTDAYREYEEKSQNHTEKSMNNMKLEIGEIIAEFAACSECGISPESEIAQAIVKKWQDYITVNLFNCTNEVLLRLADVYSTDERFKTNIDEKFKGTTEFMVEAIRIYCK